MGLRGKAWTLAAVCVLSSFETYWCSPACANKDGHGKCADKEQGAEGSTLKEYSMQDVESHNNETSCWVVIDGAVVDATLFLNKHPGGAARILKMAGKNATDAFSVIGHSKAAKKLVAHYAIGTIGNVVVVKPDVSELTAHKDWLMSLSADSPFFSRLFSDHDMQHVHALLGGAVLLSNAWRLVVAVGSGFGRWTMSHPTVFNVATLALHMALPLSALQFDVPVRKKEFNILYASRRREIILFCMKYASAVVLRWYSPAGADVLLKLAHVVLAHIIIDISNMYFDPFYDENGTPVRGSKKSIYSAEDKANWENYFARTFHHFGPMFSQTMAVITSLDLVSGTCDPRAVIDTMFWSLLPIQGHAFTLTLVRKNLLYDGVLKFALYGIMLLPGSANAIFNGGRMTVFATFAYMFLRSMLPPGIFTKYFIYLILLGGATWIRQRSVKAKGE